MASAEPSQVDSNIATIPWPRDPPEFRALDGGFAAVTDPAALTALRKTASTELGNWIERLQTAGVTADRHNSPDLLGQLKAALRRPIDTVLCGALDVDPGACLNSALAARYPLELTAAMMVIGRISGARRVAVIADARVPGIWHEALGRACDGVDIRLERIINDYPQADPTLLVYTMLGRRLRPGRLPTEQGAILLDAAAALAVGRFALSEQPMQTVPLAVRDHAADQSEYVLAPTGMPLRELLIRIGFEWAGRVLRAGDLLRDVHVGSDTILGPRELIYHSSLPHIQAAAHSCIRCGWCVDACPTNVHPATALEASQLADLDLAERSGIEACIECGICSYVCPSYLPLLEGIRRMKQIQHERLGEHV